ncbi:hypothetical protein ACRE_002570 [Hapsidospora chrysogenum ATCC 11550]|uniref:Uncharacterized protein n=1 Tax=Hapsidospora chrysogenum (strain ATCC 11550 / CBS 779.69 / DSM 880 / IAM 14645 / JCM 23072 / IMI 49137) TaxID=857340 RepID=A0A086TIB2_HAPC1|nr:hypothetical protein ACRE_002570 [Hapsidospora chrysogenum ATCC 11550]
MLALPTLHLMLFAIACCVLLGLLLVSLKMDCAKVAFTGAKYLSIWFMIHLMFVQVLHWGWVDVLPGVWAIFELIGEIYSDQ